jgi:branched-chain amino acid aminotransferase
MTFAPPCEWVYLDDRIVSAAEAAVSVHAHALSYGTGTFEGIRAWWNPDAVRQGYDDAIMLTVDGFVAEASTSNIMVRQGSTWFTPPVTDDILPGITRRAITELMPVAQRRIHRSELYTSSEILLCGTATVVVPVTEVDGRPVGDGQPGETTVSLNSTIRAIARRTDPRHPEWTTEV